MQKLISTSTAYYGAGNSLTRRSFVVKSGSYSGRKLIIYPSDASTLECRFADPPYSDWSDPTEVATDAADFPGCGWLDDDGNVCFVYAQQTTLNLIFIKLTFEMGTWSVGSPVTVFAGGGCYFPSIARDSLERLHVTYTWYDSGSGNYRIRYKRSTVDGAVWGSGASDAGTDITSGSVAAYSQLQYAAPHLYCIYTDASTKLAIKELIDGGLVWGSEVAAFTGILLSDHFSAAISEGGKLLGIAFEAVGKLFYIEYDGQTWGGVHELAVGSAIPPLLQFSGSDPYVVYGISQGTGQAAVVWRRKQGAGFAHEEEVGGELTTFLDVVVYDDDAPTQFVSRKDQAADTTAADVSHSTSGALVAAANDAVYFGASQPFATIACNLSTAGVSGQVAWEYFDGSVWQEFTPASGAYHFDQLSQVVRLWADSVSAPSGWQPTQIGSTKAHWVRARVTTAYSTAPVGSQLTPLTDVKYLTI